MGEPLHKILAVEDNAEIRTILALALEKVGGLKVRACASGAEALDAVTEFAPQLILLDVMMPGMDGPTTLKRLRELPAAANIPVVFLTARTTSEEIQTLRDAGALDVVAKPFDPMTLHVTIRELWARAVPGL